MELSEVQQFIEANKDKPEVQKFVSGFVTADKVSSYLSTEDGSKILQPIKDQHFSKSLETWKAKNLQSIIDEEVGKRNPKETDEQKRLRKLEEENAAIKKQNRLSDMKGKAVKFASEKNIPVSLFDHLSYPDTEEELSTKLGAIAEIFKDIQLKNNGRPRPAGNGDPSPKGSMNNIIRKAAGYEQQ